MKKFYQKPSETSSENGKKTIGSTITVLIGAWNTALPMCQQTKISRQYHSCLWIFFNITKIFEKMLRRIFPRIERFCDKFNENFKIKRADRDISLDNSSCCFSYFRLPQYVQYSFGHHTNYKVNSILPFLPFWELLVTSLELRL